MFCRLLSICSILAIWLVSCGQAVQKLPVTGNTSRWSAEKAHSWYARQGWLVGCNYAPASAINQLEMFQAATFDPARIDLELGWAENLGMTTMRIFLHDLLWEQDAAGLKKRLDTVLELCQKHKIKPLIVLFDSCWDPNPKLGMQHAPVPGVHNSGWVQSPGARALEDASQYPRLKNYVTGIISAFAKDQRILGWDLWNEPDGVSGANTYGKFEPANKVTLVEKLLAQVFVWARSANPTQPLTSGVWEHGGYDWSSPEKWTAMERIQLSQSDFITFHTYADSATFRRNVKWLKALGRPVICTEYLARGFNSTFETILPVGKSENIGMINWGFVQGKLQTELPWDSWDKPYTNGHILKIWHHEVLRNDGTPYRKEETELIQKMTRNFF